MDLEQEMHDMYTNNRKEWDEETAHAINDTKYCDLPVPY